MFKREDLTGLNWSANPRDTKGTGGTFLKAELQSGRYRYYYKMSHYNDSVGIYGHEAALEVLAYHLLTALGIPCCKYELIDADLRIDDRNFRGYVSKSPDFKKKGESKVSFEEHYRLKRERGESPIDFCMRSGFSEYLNQMLFADFLIISRDRHGANIEVLSSENGEIRLSPLFDNGICLTAPYFSDERRMLANIDILDYSVNNFFGTPSLTDNLKYMTAPVAVNALTAKKLNNILKKFKGVLTDSHLSILERMIARRYEYAKEKKILSER